MKKLILMAVLAISALTANAQQYRITPHVDIAYMHYSGYDRDFEDGLGFLVGGDFEYFVAKNFGVSAGIDFLFGKSDQVKESFEGESYAGWQHINHTYLNIPVLAQYHVGRVAFKAGLQPAFLLSAKYKTENLGSYSIKDRYNTMSLALPVGISVDFNIPLTLDLRCAIPLTNQAKNDKALNEHANVKLTTVSRTLGYRF